MFHEPLTALDFVMDRDYLDRLRAELKGTNREQQCDAMSGISASGFGFIRAGCKIAERAYAYERLSKENPFWHLEQHASRNYLSAGATYEELVVDPWEQGIENDLFYSDGVERMLGCVGVLFKDMVINMVFVRVGDVCEEDGWKLCVIRCYEPDHETDFEVEFQRKILVGEKLAEYCDIHLGLDLRILYTSEWESSPARMWRPGVQAHVLEFHNADHYTWSEIYEASDRYGLYRVPRHARELMRQGDP